MMKKFVLFIIAIFVLLAFKKTKKQFSIKATLDFSLVSDSGKFGLYSQKEGIITIFLQGIQNHSSGIVDFYRNSLSVLYHEIGHELDPTSDDRMVRFSNLWKECSLGTMSIEDMEERELILDIESEEMAFEFGSIACPSFLRSHFINMNERNIVNRKNPVTISAS